MVECNYLWNADAVMCVLGVCVYVSRLICMCAEPLPFVRARSMWLPAIRALGSIFLLSDGIWGLGEGLSCTETEGGREGGDGR